MIITHDSLWTDRLLSSFSVKYFISFLYVELPRILLLSENYSPVIASATTDKRYFETNHPLMITLRKALISALVLGVSIVKKIQMFMFTTLAWISGI